MSKCHDILLGSAVSLALIAVFMAPAFGIAQDTPTTIDGVRAVCTGVGETKNNPRWRAYPVKLIFANKKGQYTAGEKIDITENGHTVMETNCDAPWLLIKPASGKYRVTATLQTPNGDRRTSADFSENGKGPQKAVTLDFPMAQTG